MKKILNKILIFFVLFFMYQGSGLAQDLHYSQFYLSPLNINPALTGVFNGDIRYSASIKDQWRSVPVPWFTFTAGYDRKFYTKNSSDHFFGGGIYFNYDKQGASKINLGNLNISASYNRVINKNNIITLGGLIGYTTRGFNPSTLTWDKQWNGTAYDPSASSGEAFDLERYNFLETALGLNYRYQTSERTKIDLGAGLYHITQPTADFKRSGEIDVNDIEQLPMRLSLSAHGTAKLIDMLDLELDVLYQDQLTYSELIFGGYFNIYLNQKRGKTTNLHLGAGYRTSRAVYPKVALQLNNIFVALSYDIDLSEFSQTHNRTGGPEIHFNYIITHVKSMGKFKVCPIF